MGQGGHCHITSITTDKLDLNGIVRRVDDGLDEAEKVCCASCKARPKARLSKPLRPMLAAPPRAGTDCVKKRDPRGDETRSDEGMELDSNGLDVIR